MATNVLVYLREEAQKAALLKIAARDGFINKKGEPSISTLVQSIANGEAVVVNVVILDDILCGIRESGFNLPPYAEAAIKAVEALIGDAN